MTALVQTSFELGSSDPAAVSPVAEGSFMHNVGGECHVCGRDSRITPRLETCVDCRRVVCVGTCIHWYPEGTYYGFSWSGGWSCSNCFGDADASEADPDDDIGSDENDEPHVPQGQVPPAPAGDVTALIQTFLTVDLMRSHAVTDTVEPAPPVQAGGCGVGR